MNIKYIFFILIIIVIVIFIYNKDSYNEIYSFDIDITKSKKEANEISKKYDGSIVIESKDGFHISLALFNNIDIVNKMLLYFDKNNVDIILSKLDCNKKFYEELNKYEIILKNLDDDRYYEKVNKILLDKYVGEL